MTYDLMESDRSSDHRSAMKAPTGWAVTIDIEAELERARVAQARQGAGHEYTMFRVPWYIRNLKPQAYDPVVLFVGLYNRDSPTMSHIDEVRVEVANNFLELMKIFHGVRNWDHLCLLVACAGRPEEAEALQKLYADEPGGSVVCVTSTVVRGILTLDAVFLTNLLILYYSGFYDTQPPVWSHLETVQCVFRQKGIDHNAGPMLTDIWLFENQVPLSTVRNVWNHVQELSDIRQSRLGCRLSVQNVWKKRATAARTTGRGGWDFDSFLRDTIFAAMEKYKLPRSEDSDHKISFEDCSHLLHCLHKAVCLPSPAEQRETLNTLASTIKSLFQEIINRITTLSPIGWLASTLRSLFAEYMREIGPEKTSDFAHASLPSISELLKEGIVVRGRRATVSDVEFAPSTFYKATLYLPQIGIDDDTERILQNLVVFESIRLVHEEHKFIAYLSIMDNLINTEEDVQVLRKGKAPVIVMNDLGDDKCIATLFNSLLQNIHFNPYQKYRVLIRDVNNWRAHQRRLRWIWFIERFVDQPWILVSLIAGTLLLIMTVLQTTYTVLAFYKQ